jgi:hypothetical protein
MRKAAGDSKCPGIERGVCVAASADVNLQFVLDSIVRVEKTVAVTLRTWAQVYGR